ncbi:hypothetical protein JAAARDRAFT_74002 [Jaapia argillacea MUCL 33604]|uniref:Uncharacterized protein n=1 Tax=Jaapia argillacea MUCL 33604 TaxID=933084 RepID=A0A067PIE2_9AGAM|nr:hypothetical protein JAAARDRAFT_74002 [Jaapia argillacea MUCL 33604]
MLRAVLKQRNVLEALRAPQGISSVVLSLRRFSRGRVEPLPKITFFHDPNVRKSMKLLKSIEEARTEPYPRPTKSRPTKSPPLTFDIQVEERIPTADEFSDLIHFASTPSYTIFLQDKALASYKTHPTTAKTLHEIVERDPDLLRWPLVVNWETEQLSIADIPDIKRMLETLVKKRDRVEDVPKEPPPPPKPTEWIDYD